VARWRVNFNVKKLCETWSHLGWIGLCAVMCFALFSLFAGMAYLIAGPWGFGLAGFFFGAAICKIYVNSH
jgi:hypothetical protein